MLLYLGGLSLTIRGAPAQAELPDSIHSEGVPAIPAGLDDLVDRYRFKQVAVFQGWLPKHRAMVCLAPVDGTMQAFLISKPGGPLEQLTFQRQSLEWISPNPDGQRFVFTLDHAGAEQFQWYHFDRRSGDTRSFTSPYWYTHSGCWSRDGKSLALSSNARNDRDCDLYVVEPPSRATGHRLRETKGCCLAGDWSPDDKRIAAVEYSRDRMEARVLLIDVQSGAVKPIPQPPGRPVVRGGVNWSDDGTSLYWIADRDSEFYHLARYELSTGREVSLTDDIHWDIDSCAISADHQKMVVLANEDGWSRIHVFDGVTGREQLAPRLAKGRFTGIAFREDSHEFSIVWHSPQAPAALYSYDLDTGKGTRWFQPEPASPSAGLRSDPTLVRYPSFDGRDIPAFVSYPRRPSKGRRPVLIVIHGGPQFQYRPEVSSFEDFLMETFGLVIIHPNVRGSTGYGRSYHELDNGRQREDAVRDIGALLDWIAKQPNLDASRVAVSGGSYGGYMALTSLVRYSDRLRAGIDYAGSCDIETLVRSSRLMSIDYRRVEYGDERDPEALEFLRSISPLEHAAKIHKPLLMIHGENDPRIKISEADKIVAAVCKNGVPVWYIRFSGEGHSLAKPEHARYALHAQVLFLMHHLLAGL